ncbi:hypothetical protein [Halopiger goleimassiliensis]|uniref:hypothetical protein n=1 Tax=Halopiger goleimassiliensis TaxID=1293048 RepID=UPI000677CCEA|nr:hypothetical protein [Halopiger goleimassiliensis]
MIDANLAVAGCGLALAVAIGLLVHEGTHALVLRLARIEYGVSLFPGRSKGVLGLLASCPWAAVHPRPAGEVPPWKLRLAALAPLAMGLPVLVFVGSGTVSLETPLGTAVTIGWLGCAIPSPQDFSVAFYAHRRLEADASGFDATVADD